MKRIYVYIDYTDDFKPFYVGKGLKNRINVQKRNYKHTNSCKKFGFNRKIIFETFDNELALQKECEVIANLHTFIHDDLADKIACNLTLGGEGSAGNIQTDFQKLRAREANLGRIKSQEEIEKIKNKLIGRENKKTSARNKAAIGDKNPFFGKKHTEKSLQKMSEAHKNVIPHNKGVKMSDEQKQKLRGPRIHMRGKIGPNIGRKFSEETRKKQSIAHLGSKRSAETKLKMSLANQRRNFSKFIFKYLEFVCC